MSAITWRQFGILLCLLGTCLYSLIPGIQPWMVMIAVGVSIFLILKVAMLAHAVTTGGFPTQWRIWVWFAAWPGMNADTFFRRVKCTNIHIGRRDWLVGSCWVVVGCCLTLTAHVIAPWSRAAAGWLAMIGLLMAVHFGIIHLVACAWRRAGVDVRPIMNAPWSASALSDFWSCRWNLAFRDFAHTYIQRPLSRRWNTSIATWCCFAISGLIHELAISVPAGAGFGLPTVYFLLQACGVWLERSPFGRRFGLRAGWRGRCFTLLFVVPAAYVLFHPPFLQNVILPLIGVN